MVHGLDSYAWDVGAPEIAEAYVAAGFDVLVYDSRAQGASSGKRLGLGWAERSDVAAAVSLLLDRGFKPRRIGIHGTSYGAAIALLAAAAVPEIGAVVADSSFADVRDVMVARIAERTGLPSGLAELLRPGIELIARLGYRLDLYAIQPERAVPRIAPRPILFIHGSDDDVIPVEHARRLKSASRNAADELMILDGQGHTEGMVTLQDEPSPMRETFMACAVSFFDRSL